MFSSRYMPFPTFLEEDKISDGGQKIGGAWEVFYFEKRSFLI